MDKKLCKDQKEGLVVKLTASFKELTQEEIDEVVTEARTQAKSENLQERKESLANLFDNQMRTLKERDCSKTIIEAFLNQKSMVLDKAAKTDVAEGNIPFIPVIPRIYMGVYGLMPMVRNGVKVGYACLDPNEIVNVVKVLNKPYFILDVENGKETLGKSSEKAEKLIKEQERSCLITEESIALCVHTDVLSDHYVGCEGSRFGSGGAPFIFLDVGVPRLDWRYEGHSSDDWGSPSCGSRFAFEL